MKRNCLKIVSNPTNNTLAFYIKSKDRWQLVPSSSDLSRKEYTETSIKEKASEIIAYINTVYNMCNRGVDIYFEGMPEDYQILVAVIKNRFPDFDLQCIAQKTVIAVAGKCNCGKTVLIEELCKFKETQYSHYVEDGVHIYQDENGTMIWYEIPGIDIGVEHVSAARAVFEKLAGKGLTSLVYCLGTSKIEPLEEEFIGYVQSKHPSVHILLALTQFKEENSDVFVDQLTTQLNGVKVIPVLAKDIRIRNGIIPAYGLENVDSFIFEGK